MATLEGKEILRRNGSYSTAVVTTWQLIEQNKGNNTSTIRLRQYFYYGGGTSVGSDYSSFGVMGKELKTGKYRYNPGYTLLGTNDITVSHNSDGTFPQTNVGMWSYSFHFRPSDETWGNIPYGSVSTIPRHAKITGGNDITDEENPQISFNNPGNFPLSFKVEAGGDVQLITRENINNAKSPYTVELNSEERRKLLLKCPNSNILNVRYTIATTINGVLQGWNWVDRKMTVVNANPVFNMFTFKDINSKTVALTGNNQNLIIGQSNIQAIVPAANKATPKKEASMSKYRLSIGNQSKDFNYSSSADVNGVINGASNGTISVFAVDSRNNSTEVKKLANKVINYTPLNKINIDVIRTNGVSEDTKLILEGNINLINFGKITNSIKYSQFRYKNTSSSSWSSYKPIKLNVSGNKFTYNGLITGDTQRGFNINNSYQIEVLIKDELSEVTFTDTLGSGIPTLALAKKGVGIMGKYNDSLGGSLQIDGNQVLEEKTVGTNTGLKFYDGTLICYGYKELNDVNVKNNWGNLFATGAMNIFDNFAIPFKSEPVVHYFRTGTFQAWLMANGDSNATNLKPGTIELLRPTPSTLPYSKIQYIAFGRWK